jgi:hypothetical protein
MKEEYLHYIWKMKRLPWHLLRLTDGRNLLVNNVGIYNAYENGPDFQQGCVNIEGIKWYGSIELHIKSSDWYKHQHHLDKNYDNVILHVVYQDDVPVYVKNQKLPTLELQTFLDHVHFSRYQKWQSEKEIFPCKPFFKSLPEAYFTNMQTRALLSRLHRKTHFLETDSPWLALSLLCARALGKNLHQENYFLILNHALNNAIGLPGLSDWENQINDAIEVLTEQHKLAWKTKGNRPAKKELVLLARMSHLFLFCSTPDVKTAHFSELKDFWNKMLHTNGLEKGIIYNNLHINAFIPWLYWLAEKYQRAEFYDLFYDELAILPKENNHITRLWEKHLCEIDNAANSQSIMEIYKHFCSRKRCLDCTIGHKILNP